MSSSECVAQVIVERSFPNKESAQAWIDEQLELLQNKNKRARLTTESHIWENASS